MEKINKILNHRLAQRGLSKTVESAQICFWVSKWDNSRCQPISFSKGILKLSVKSAAEASELQMESENLIDFINQKMAKKIVQRVRIINSF